MIELKPKISIIIPIYNAENTISKCLSSMQNQTYDNLEIICVDDNSKDSSMNIVKDMMKTDDRMVLIESEVNSGTLAARKKGVEIASGDYIMFADNDDWYELNACERLVNEIKKGQTDIVMYSFRPVGSDKGSDEIELMKMTRLGQTKPESINASNCLLTKNRMNLLWNKFIKADICKQAYSCTEDIYLTIAEDTYACWLIHYFAKSFKTIPDVLYNWNITTGISNKKFYTVEKFNTFCKSMNDYEKATTAFFTEVDKNGEMLEVFIQRGGSRVGYCVDTCVKNVKEEDFPEALNLIIYYFGEERTFLYIQNSIRKKNKRIISQQRKITALEKKNLKLKNSNSYKIGRIITKPVRMVKVEKR